MGMACETTPILGHRTFCRPDFHRGKEHLVTIGFNGTEEFTNPPSLREILEVIHAGSGNETNMPHALFRHPDQSLGVKYNKLHSEAGL